MSDTAQAYAPFPYTTAEPTTITHTAATGHPLADALGAAVPFLIHDLVERGSPTDDDWAEAAAFADVLAYKGDILQYGGRKGEAAKLFAALAKSIAVLAFKDGGITCFGTHYEAHARPELPVQP